MAGHSRQARPEAAEREQGQHLVGDRRSHPLACGRVEQRHVDVIKIAEAVRFTRVSDRGVRCYVRVLL